jgi:hypothetical protein
LSIALPDVTLCAADCLNPALAARALIECQQQCTFADSILFCDTQVPGPFRNVTIAALESRAAYSAFILKGLASYVSTPFVLIVQWDGYVLAAEAWRSEFLDYDYIGAVWPWHKDDMQVGNGGFSLRSKRLIDLTAQRGFEIVGDQNEDVLIGRTHRQQLEQHHNIRIAPVSVAERFSYERGIPNAPTFGFHGLFNLWRHASDETLIQISGQLAPQVVRSREFVELLYQYLAMRKWIPAAALFAKLQASTSLPRIHELVAASLGSGALANDLLKKCNRMGIAR